MVAADVGKSPSLACIRAAILPLGTQLLQLTIVSMSVTPAWWAEGCDNGLTSMTQEVTMILTEANRQSICGFHDWQFHPYGTYSEEVGVLMVFSIQSLSREVSSSLLTIEAVSGCKSQRHIPMRKLTTNTWYGGTRFSHYVRRTFPTGLEV